MMQGQMSLLSDLVIIAMEKTLQPLLGRIRSRCFNVYVTKQPFALLLIGHLFTQSSSELSSLAFFNLGLRTTAIAWSPRSVSPDVSDDWLVECVPLIHCLLHIPFSLSPLSRLVISTHDFGLHLLTKSEDSPERIMSFGGGLTGHHGRINDITFVGGQDDNARHVATVSGQ